MEVTSASIPKHLANEQGFQCLSHSAGPLDLVVRRRSDRGFREFSGVARLNVRIVHESNAGWRYGVVWMIRGSVAESSVMPAGNNMRDGIDARILTARSGMLLREYHGNAWFNGSLSTSCESSHIFAETYVNGVP